MSHEPDDLDRLLGSLAKQGRLQPDPDPEEHPGSGTLFAYYEGKLSPEQRLQLEEHLSICGRCRDLLVEYKQFAEDPVDGEGEPEERGRVTDFGAAADWKRLRGRMGEEERKQRVDAAYEPGAPRGFFRSLKTAYSIAAMLAAGLIGLSLYTVSLQRKEKDPEETTPTVSLSPTERSELEEVRLAPGEEKRIPFEVAVAVEDIESYSAYVLMVFTEDGREVITWDELDEDNSEFHFSLESNLFAPGIYKLQILGLKEGKASTLGEFQFRFIQ